MESPLIYILDEKIPDSQLKDQIAKTQPLTKEEVVDLIISKIDGQDEIEFNAFRQNYENVGFNYKKNEIKCETYQKDLEDLVESHQFLGTLNDPDELKSDILIYLTVFQIVEEYTILYNRQIQDWIKTAASWRLLCKKKEYLIQALDKLMSSVNGKNDSSTQPPERAFKKQPQKLGKANDEIQVVKEGEKKIPEKWFALQHMIYVKIRKIEKFEKISDKKSIIDYGKNNYPIKGTGQVFYKHIQLIDNYGIYRYLQEILKKDFRKWKDTIKKISNNDPDITEWIDKNKM